MNFCGKLIRWSSTGLRNHSTLTTNEIRQIFVDYFRDVHQHVFVKSSSVVPKNDASLLVVNAGMNQFKPIFLGTIKEDDPMFKLRRAVNSQKCIRMGGKHCDLDAVGRDFRHHTFFEMLGNWSFGDYFKREAIEMAWSLLVDVYKLDTRRLFVTYFGGNEQLNLQPDRETYEFWRELGLQEERIIPLGVADNFWEMGDTGPCGVCTEIHYLSKPVSSSATAEEYLRNSLEIWNLVFMQYEKTTDGSLKLLPRRHVDTGMGLERIVSVIQGVNSNYDTDLFQPLLNFIHQLTKCPPYGGSLTNPLDIAYRILADHARLYSVAIADGLTPGPHHANYLVRKVIRRSAWQATKVFKMAAPSNLLTMLADQVAATLSEPYPEVKDQLYDIKGFINRDLKTYRKAVKNAERLFEKRYRSNPSRFTSWEAAKFIREHGLPEEMAGELAGLIGVSIDLTEVKSSPPLEQHAQV